MKETDLKPTNSMYIKGSIVEQYENPLITQAINSIYQNFGDVVSVTDKAKTLYKFGRNADIGTGAYTTVQREGGDETYCTTNAIDKFSSSNAGDTQEIVIEGHTIADGELTFATQTVTLNGQTETSLTTPLARVTRLYNNGTTDFTGDIYVYEDDTVTGGVPQTASKIHMKVTDGNQSEKCSTSFSNSDYFIVTEFIGHVFEKTSVNVEFIGELRQVGTTNKVFRRVFSTAGSNGQPTVVKFDPPIIIPKNYDARVRAISSSAGTDVGAAFNGYLAEVTA